MQKIMIGIVFVLLTFFSFQTKAQYNPNAWVEIASVKSDNETMVYFLKKDSVYVFKKDNTYFIVGIIQAQSEDTNEYLKILITGEDCVAGFGSLGFEDVNNRNFHKVSYVSGGQSIGSGLGDALCKGNYWNGNVIDLDKKSSKSDSNK